MLERLEAVVLVISLGRLERESAVSDETPLIDEQSQPAPEERPKEKFQLFGETLFGEELQQDKQGKIRERFEFPPFSVLNAREGPWQERKRAWISIGIKSELGRGATPGTIIEGSRGDEPGERGLSAGLVKLREEQKETRELIPN